MEWLLEYEGVTPERRARDARRRCSRRASSASCSSTRTSLAAAAGFIGGHVAFPKLELGEAYDEAMRTRVFGPLGMTTTTFDFTRALAGNHAVRARARHRRQAGAGRDGRELLGHPGASRRRRVEQRARHAEVRPDGARRRQAAERQAVRREGHAARAPRAAGRDRQGRDLRHGPHGRHEVRHAGRPSRRRHDRLPQRHDLAARAQRRRGDPDERRSGLGAPRLVPPQAARGAVRRQARSRRRRRRAGEELVRRSSPPSASC